MEQTKGVEMPAAHATRNHHKLVRGIEHVGIVVPDIRAAETFFADVFGAEVLYRSATPEGPEMAGADIGDVNGMPKDNSFKAVSMLRLGAGANIELFEVGSLTRDKVPAMTDLGVTHFSIYCDDLKVFEDAMRSAGGTMLEGPSAMDGQEAGNGNYIWFGRTPWGSLIELIQFPTPPTCDAPEARHSRWRPSSVLEVNP
jgi:catechol 2,3-dioxygenase-like lactoylglutathione lyase family enzyme